jgi:glycosyltransferase involved in cell wall biosynthesis
MRIAVANWSFRKVGGAETYLDAIVPQLCAGGHELACVCEVDVPASRQRIRLPDEGQLWCASAIGRARLLALVREWRPHVIYVHKILDPSFEEELLGVAPAVLFAHDYNGMCISGLKTFKFPYVRPCSRTFGWRCLLHYVPRRCGGRSPLTMWRLFKIQSRRLSLLRRYQAVLTYSAYMLSELLKHELSPQAVHNSLYLIEKGKIEAESLSCGIEHADPEPSSTTPVRLLFTGRMDRLKGGAVLIDALPAVAAALNRPLQVTFAGDGPARRLWEKRAQAIQKRQSEICIQFIGWLDSNRLHMVFADSDLLVVPSLWPEPFGRVGPEAGLHSLPVAAFAVGGVSEWLLDGVNGRLAPGDPPSAAGLARAIAECLRDPKTHQRLRRGALKVAQRFSPANHMAQLERLFEEVAGNGLGHRCTSGVAAALSS